MSRLDVIKEYAVGPDQSVRRDCPFCGGRATLSISNRRGTLVWNCFTAGCKARGASSASMSVDSLRNSFRRDKDTSTGLSGYVVPGDWTLVGSNKRILNYLDRVNCIPAFRAGLIHVRYDPSQDRAVFLNMRDSHVVGAVGRALTQREKQPKWYRYDKTEAPFIVTSPSNPKVAIIVEDAASAGAVSPLATGFALLGTSLSMSHVVWLRTYERAIIALDPDAFRKSFLFYRELQGLVQTKIVKILDDLKYYPQHKIKAILGL